MSLLISAKILEIILYVLGFTPIILLQNHQNLPKKICNFRYRFACFVYLIASHLTVQCTIWRGENGTYRKNLRKVDYKDNLGCVYHHSMDLKPCSGKQGSPLPWRLFFCWFHILLENVRNLCFHDFSWYSEINEWW